jgi:hypothetical protein
VVHQDEEFSKAKLDPSDERRSSCDAATNSEARNSVGRSGPSSSCRDRPNSSENEPTFRRCDVRTRTLCTARRDCSAVDCTRTERTSSAARTHDECSGGPAYECPKCRGGTRPRCSASRDPLEGSCEESKRPPERGGGLGPSVTER